MTFTPNILLACFLAGSPACAQTPGRTAQAMERSGFVDVRSMDSTIRVSLMYARADNFTGRVLYTDLHEAYLHPKAARALAKAQKILKASHPELSLKVYSPPDAHPAKNVERSGRNTEEYLREQSQKRWGIA